MRKTANTKLLSRGDTLLGVCEGLGEDFHISPVWFRIAFIGMLFWNWQVALIAYPTVALVIYAIRALLPDMPARRIEKQEVAAGNDANPEPEAIAA